MATIALQNGKVILKDGKASCTCCDIEPMIMSYSYADDPSLGKGSKECPIAGPPCTYQEPPSCANAVVSGFLFSDEWSYIPQNKTPKAKIYAGACMDNWGNIGSAYAGIPGNNACVVGYTEFDVIDTVVLDGKKMKIPFSVTNAPHGGPYGVCGAVIEWYWE